MATGRYEYVSLFSYILLTVLRIWARITAFFFFKALTVDRKSRISGDSPVLFVVNHQSAFLDPVLIGITSGRKPWYLTRAAVFKGRLVKFFLNAIHMLPVYRPRDGVNVKEANRKTFNMCNEILGSGGSVLIFPEGNHGMLKRLRVPIRKGAARIALEAEADSAFLLGLKVVPVGINYDHPTKFRTNVLIKYGESFSVTRYRDLYAENRGAAVNNLCREIEGAIRPLILDIRSAARYDEIEKKWYQCRSTEKDPLKKFNSDKHTIEQLIKNNECLSTAYGKRKRLLPALFGFPIFIFGLILNLPVTITTKMILKKTVIDPHFNQSIMFVCGMLIVPVFILLEAYILSRYTGYYLFWLFLIPVSGIVAYDYYDRFIRKSGYVPTRNLAKGYLPD